MDVLSLSAGPSYSLAVKGDGSIVLWGQAEFGVRFQESALKNAIAVSAGASFLAITK
jgi:hypothetical protein